MQIKKSKYKDEWSFECNEKIHKQYPSHHDANCIDDPFIEQVTKENIGIKLESALV